MGTLYTWPVLLRPGKSLHYTAGSYLIPWDTCNQPGTRKRWGSEQSVQWGSSNLQEILDINNYCNTTQERILYFPHQFIIVIVIINFNNIYRNQDIKCLYHTCTFKCIGWQTAAQESSINVQCICWCHWLIANEIKVLIKSDSVTVL